MSEEELKQEETVEVELEQPESEPEQQQQQQLELEQKRNQRFLRNLPRKKILRKAIPMSILSTAKMYKNALKSSQKIPSRRARPRRSSSCSAKLKEENEKLKSQMENSQQAHLTEYGARIDNQLDLIKKAYKDAHDRGDADALVEAQQKLSQITIEQERYRLAKAQQEKVSVQKEEVTSTEVSSTEAPTQQATKPDPRAEEWATKNEWFGQDEVMTYAALEFIVSSWKNKDLIQRLMSTTMKLTSKFVRSFRTSLQVNQMGEVDRSPLLTLQLPERSQGAEQSSLVPLRWLSPTSLAFR